MAYIDDFRALASVAINENISKETRTEAEKLMVKMMDTMETSLRVDNYQLSEFLNKVSAKIEVVKG